MTRTTLPARRRNETLDVAHGETRFTLTVGFDAAGVPREVFADGHREGSAMRHILSDACVIISIALQYGIVPAELARSLGTVPTWQGDTHASPIGAIMGALASYEGVAA